MIERHDKGKADPQIVFDHSCFLPSEIDNMDLYLDRFILYLHDCTLCVLPATCSFSRRVASSQDQACRRLRIPAPGVQRLATW